MISVPISNKVYRQKQEEMKNAIGNGDFDDSLGKIAECSREFNEKINNPGTEVITDSLRDVYKRQVLRLFLSKTLKL